MTASKAGRLEFTKKKERKKKERKTALGIWYNLEGLLTAIDEHSVETQFLGTNQGVEIVY
jgi:hypothetical protein